MYVIGCKIIFFSLETPYKYYGKKYRKYRNAKI